MASAHSWSNERNQRVTKQRRPRLIVGHLPRQVHKEIHYHQRSDGYIGSHDLVISGTTEPIIVLNFGQSIDSYYATIMLIASSTEIGRPNWLLVDDQRYETYLAKKALVDAEIKRLRKL